MFFFAKHCAVREWLARQPSNYVAAVLDTDIGVIAADASLAPWMEDGADIVFYTRMWNYEIAAGNYIVRNTEFSRTFLQAWTMFFNHLPKGFSSFDNGAVHLALLQAVGIPNHDCYQQYQLLRGEIDKNDLKSNQWLVTYYKFLACVRRIMGVGRYWDVSMGRSSTSLSSMNKDETGSSHDLHLQSVVPVDGRITIENRFHGFAYDAGLLHNIRIGGRIPFHHGLKNMVEAARLYSPEFQLKSTIMGNDQPPSGEEGEWVNARDNTAVVFRCAFDPTVRCGMRYGAHGAHGAHGAKKNLSPPFGSTLEQAKELSVLESTWLSIGHAGDPWSVVPHYDLSGCLVETVAFGCRTKQGMPGGELDTYVLLGDDHRNTSLIKWWGNESSPSYKSQLANNMINYIIT
jgi:hypothetical protein